MDDRPETAYPPTPLLIPADLLDGMVDHARREAPRECCGILAGVTPRVSSRYPLRNAAESATTRYDADPREIIDAVRDMRARGTEMLAIYHSHPRWQAVPSRTDLDLNHYGPLPRIIVSLLGAKPEVRSWRLDADSYHELPWRSVPVEPGAASGYTAHPEQAARVPGAPPTMQRTLIIFKPDCVQRRLVGAILHRFEARGLRLVALKLVQVGRALGEQHYGEHQGKPFFVGLIDFITAAPVVVGVLEGNEAIAVVRAMLGATNGAAAAPGTVRGDYSLSKQNNLVHGSDSPESAAREIALWFRPEELVDYQVAGSQWVFDGA